MINSRVLCETSVGYWAGQEIVAPYGLSQPTKAEVSRRLSHCSKFNLEI